MQKIQRRFGSRNRQLGQGMTEYIIITALIAIAAIGAFTFFGGTVRGQMAVMAKELGGQTATSETNRVKNQMNAAAAEGVKDKNLADYTNEHTK